MTDAKLYGTPEERAQYFRELAAKRKSSGLQNSDPETRKKVSQLGVEARRKKLEEWKKANDV